MSLVVATRNDHKVREFRDLLAGFRLRGLPADAPTPEETGSTFEANALIKARSACQATGSASFADDSGIEAAALGGRPGVYSARFAGEAASDRENLALLLDEVEKAGDDRRVRYVCVIAYVEPGGSELIFHGVCEGLLAEKPRGSGGFGYDPAFIPDATGSDDLRTVAELSDSEKHAISHRGIAARELFTYLSAS